MEKKTTSALFAERLKLFDAIAHVKLSALADPAVARKVARFRAIERELRARGAVRVWRR